MRTLPMLRHIMLLQDLNRKHTLPNKAGLLHSPGKMFKEQPRHVRLLLLPEWAAADILWVEEMEENIRNSGVSKKLRKAISFKYRILNKEF